MRTRTKIINMIRDTIREAEPTAQIEKMRNKNIDKALAIAFLLLLSPVIKVFAQDRSKIIVGNTLLLDATPPAYSYNGKVSLYIRTGNWENGYNYELYDDEFKSNENVEEVREEEVSNGMYNYTYFYTKRESDYENYQEFGERFPRLYYRFFKNFGILEKFYAYYNLVYLPVGDWLETVTESNFTPEDLSLGIINFNEYQATNSKYGDYLTQTLFNDDEQFELLVPYYKYGEVEYSDRWDGDGDVYLTVKTVGDILFAGFQVISETGQVINTIEFEEGFTGSRSWRDEPDYNVVIYEINGKTYLAVSGYIDSEEGSKDAILVYSIDRKTSEIKKVAQETQMTVRPRLATRSELIDVSLEPDVQNRELQVVNTAGEVILRAPVKAGATHCQIAASKLSKGVNIINVTTKRGNSTCKIIVK